jgi:uncharacterized membrane protein
MTETRTRTIVRSVSYRATAWAFTVLWTYLFTGDFMKSAGFSSVLHLALSVDYYVHERLWLRVKWGTK